MVQMEQGGKGELVSVEDLGESWPSTPPPASKPPGAQLCLLWVCFVSDSRSCHWISLWTNSDLSLSGGEREGILVKIVPSYAPSLKSCVPTEGKKAQENRKKWALWGEGVGWKG